MLRSPLQVQKTTEMRKSDWKDAVFNTQDWMKRRFGRSHELIEWILIHRGNVLVQHCMIAVSNVHSLFRIILVATNSIGAVDALSEMIAETCLEFREWDLYLAEARPCKVYPKWTHRLVSDSFGPPCVTSGTTMGTCCNHGHGNGCLTIWPRGVRPVQTLVSGKWCVNCSLMWR